MRTEWLAMWMQRTASVTPTTTSGKKKLLLIKFDDHGKPPLRAHHFFPCALDPTFNSGEGDNAKPPASTRARLAKRGRTPHEALWRGQGVC